VSDKRSRIPRELHTRSSAGIQVSPWRSPGGGLPGSSSAGS